MADQGKRQNAAPPKVALPKQAPVTYPIPNAFPNKAQVTSKQTAKRVAPHVQELTKFVEARIKLTNNLNQDLTGVVYSCENGQLVLDTEGDSYHIIQLSKINKFEVLPLFEVLPTGQPANQEAADVRAAKEKERLAKLKAERLAEPAGVSTIGHKIFLMLDKTLPVRWHEKSIIVLDNVIIEPPYDVENCKAPIKHDKQLQRVRELVKNELAKMPKENTWDRRGG